MVIIETKGIEEEMYKITIPPIPNMGDRLNMEMLEDIFGINVVQTDDLKSNMSAIGSSLGELLWSERMKVRLKQCAYYPFASNDFYVWGTGFLSNKTHKENSFYFRRMHFCSVRGMNSKKRVEDIIGRKMDIPIGDGGLLVNRWIGGAIRKKHSIGIIPHFREQDHPLICQIANYYNDSIVIDLTEEPRDVVKKIAECNVILSSSLHGLIVSDSFHIPNKHMILYQYGERIRGDGFKFSDYYSSYGIKDDPVVMRNGIWPRVDDIVSNYLVDSMVVEKKKDQIYRCFPRL